MSVLIIEVEYPNCLFIICFFKYTIGFNIFWPLTTDIIAVIHINKDNNTNKVGNLFSVFMTLLFNILSLFSFHYEYPFGVQFPQL